MPKDYKTQFIKEIEKQLALRYKSENIIDITDIIIEVLDHYEIINKPIESIEKIDNINKEILKQYAACLFINGKSQGTIYQYIRTCKKLIEVINKPFSEINVYDIRLFLIKEMERGVSARTRENTRANLSAFFQWAVNEEIISKNPIASIRTIKYTDEIRKPFSEVEIDALRMACHTKKERALIEILLSTGIRVSELANMKVKDINKETLVVHVIKGKGQKERITYTTPVAINHLIAYLNERKEKDGEMLFYNKNHTPLGVDGIRYILKVIATRAKINDVHPHRFRRTFATNLSKRGMDIQEIQRLMGHSNLNTTMVYILTDDSQVQNAYKKFMT